MRRKNKKFKFHDEPYWKREGLHTDGKDEHGRPNFIRRKPHFKEILHYYWWEFLAGLIRVIIWPFQKTGEFLYAIFWPKSNFRFNGIIGPGGHTSYERHFSWGKLSLALVIAFIIVYFIFLR